MKEKVINVEFSTNELPKDIEVKNEKYFRSKGNHGRAYDMARITIELPITAWRGMKSKIYGDELISHQRRSSDMGKEKGLKCTGCDNCDVILREKTKKEQTKQGEVKYKIVLYKCKRCGIEFYTDVLIKENEKRLSKAMKKNKN